MQMAMFMPLIDHFIPFVRGLGKERLLNRCSISAVTLAMINDSSLSCAQRQAAFPFAQATTALSKDLSYDQDMQ